MEARGSKRLGGTGGRKVRTRRLRVCSREGRGYASGRSGTAACSRRLPRSACEAGCSAGNTGARSSRQAATSRNWGFLPSRINCRFIEAAPTALDVHIGCCPQAGDNAVHKRSESQAYMVVVGMRLDESRRKDIVGLWEVATEGAGVCKALLLTRCKRPCRRERACWGLVTVKRTEEGCEGPSVAPCTCPGVPGSQESECPGAPAGRGPGPARARA